MNTETLILQEKANALTNKSQFDEFSYFNGATTVTQQWHEHPETRELVIVDTWYVPDEECVSQEWEVVAVYPTIGCMMAKINKGYHNKVFIK